MLLTFFNFYLFVRLFFAAVVVFVCLFLVFFKVRAGGCNTTNDNSLVRRVSLLPIPWDAQNVRNEKKRSESLVTRLPKIQGW